MGISDALQIAFFAIILVFKERDNILTFKVLITAKKKAKKKSFYFVCVVLINEQNQGIQSAHSPPLWECMCLLCATGGDQQYRDYFFLNKTSGLLWLKHSIDREKVPKVNLILKATKDCWTSKWHFPYLLILQNR